MSTPRPTSLDRKLKSERIDSRTPLPAAWRVSRDGLKLGLDHQFASPSLALRFVASVIDLALERATAPHLHHVLGGVTVGLSTPGKGITAEDRAFASEISGLLAALGDRS